MGIALIDSAFRELVVARDVPVVVIDVLVVFMVVVSINKINLNQTIYSIIYNYWKNKHLLIQIYNLIQLYLDVQIYI